MVFHTTPYHFGCIVSWPFICDIASTSLFQGAYIHSPSCAMAARTLYFDQHLSDARVRLNDMG